MHYIIGVILSQRNIEKASIRYIITFIVISHRHVRVLGKIRVHDTEGI